jgi:hypothetical protein
MARTREKNETVVAFASQVPSSPGSIKLFEDIMCLPEELAKYLRGKGKKEAKELRDSLRIMYAKESMRLSARLVHLTSWALTMRAVREKELSLHKFRKYVEHTGIMDLCKNSSPRQIMGLPLELIRFMERAEEIVQRMQQINAVVCGKEEPQAGLEVRYDPVGRLQQHLLAALNPTTKR